MVATAPPSTENVPLKHTQQPLQALCKPLASPLQAVCKPLHFICKPRLSACLNLCVSAILGFCESRPTTFIIILIRSIAAKMDPKSCSAPRSLVDFRILQRLAPLEFYGRGLRLQQRQGLRLQFQQGLRPNRKKQPPPAWQGKVLLAICPYPQFALHGGRHGCQPPPPPPVCQGSVVQKQMSTNIT